MHNVPPQLQAFFCQTILSHHKSRRHFVALILPHLGLLRTITMRSRPSTLHTQTSACSERPPVPYYGCAGNNKQLLACWYSSSAQLLPRAQGCGRVFGINVDRPAPVSSALATRGGGDRTRDRMNERTAAWLEKIANTLLDYLRHLSGSAHIMVLHG